MIVAIQTIAIHTGHKAVWGDETMLDGLAAALLRTDRVTECIKFSPTCCTKPNPGTTDLLINMYPPSDNPRENCKTFPAGHPNQATFWWLQVPNSIERRGSWTLTRTLREFDGVLFASQQMRDGMVWWGVDLPPNRLMPMSADPEVFRYIPNIMADTDKHKPFDVVFVGNARPDPRTGRDKRAGYLEPLVGINKPNGKPLRFVIYGTGYGNDPILSQAWRGPLHPRFVPVVYNKSQIVLSSHENDHRNADMPTSRLFEAVACQRPVVSDPIPYAQEIFGDSIAWTKGGQALVDTVMKLLGTSSGRGKMAKTAYKRYLNGYTFDSHATTILELYDEVIAGRRCQQ